MVVYAVLVVNGKKRGTHPFLVRVKDDEGSLAPRVLC